jgi:hypothetical protein
VLHKADDRAGVHQAIGKAEIVHQPQITRVAGGQGIRPGVHDLVTMALRLQPATRTIRGLQDRDLSAGLLQPIGGTQSG